MAQPQSVVSALYTALPTDVDGVASLAELALDLRWSWNHSADDLWNRVDPTLWELTRNPWVILQTVSRDRLRSVLDDPAFRDALNALLDEKRQSLEEITWFQREHSASALSCAAYFSMEYMLSAALPIYSGGLGNVAGDQLKTASDLGVPVVAVGLLYQQGYFRQVVDSNGVQHALFPYNDPGQLPITPVRQADGQWLRLEIATPGYSVWLRVWQVQVGRVKLYLLDSNDPENFPVQRGITSELYGGGPELRLKQELVLGLGGWRLLRALGLNPEVCHLNEGHAALAILERAREFMEKSGQPFEVALEATRAGNVFTTHTPVEAGFDRFAPALIQQYLSGYADRRLHLSLREMMALGRANPDDDSELFNMAYLAVRGCGAVNGVSRLHGEVSRRIFQPLFPHWPGAEVPVTYITNGVHVPTWNSGEAESLWTEACGRDRWLGTTEKLEEGLRRVPDEDLWRCRSKSRASLLEYARNRLCRQLLAIGAPLEDVAAAMYAFDPNALTIGFARRFASYKRPALLLQDPDRLARILSDPHRPVQLIIAGKAHPADLAGQKIIEEWSRFIRRPEARGRVAFLSDYDMPLTERLVQGVDLWLNTPRRPWEASGTSGMKVLANGGLNLSELDGWWAEAYDPEVGWALGDGREHGDDPAWDAAEAGALYTVLEQQVIPEFYTRDSRGIPVGWVSKMRESMAQLTPRFSANRTVREYAEQLYLTAAAAFRNRSAEGGAEAARIVAWKKALSADWPKLHFSEMNVGSDDGHHTFEIQVYLNGVDPDSIRVEMYADALDEWGPEISMMERTRPLIGAAHGYIYSGRVSNRRPASDYTARVVPFRAGVSVPLEAPQILWFR